MKVKYKFTVATNYVGSRWEEEFEDEFPDDMTEDDIRAELDAEYQQWVWENIDGGIDIEIQDE